jgi:hypothetical protein
MVGVFRYASSQDYKSAGSFELFQSSGAIVAFNMRIKNDIAVSGVGDFDTAFVKSGHLSYSQFEGGLYSIVSIYNEFLMPITATFYLDCTDGSGVAHECRRVRSAFATQAAMTLIALAAIVMASSPASAQICTSSPCTGTSIFTPASGATWSRWQFLDSSQLNATEINSFGTATPLGAPSETYFNGSSALNAQAAGAVSGGSQQFESRAATNKSRSSMTQVSRHPIAGPPRRQENCHPSIKSILLPIYQGRTPQTR